MTDDSRTETTAAARARNSATAKEIGQQPRMWRTVHEQLQTQRDEIDDFLHSLLAKPDLRIVFSGAGTSAFAGEILASALQARLGVAVEAVATTDSVARPKEHFAAGAPVLLVSIARSGNSPESVAAAALAERCAPECYHLILTCNAQGQLCRTYADAEHALVLTMPPETNDTGFAMTSSVTTMMWAALCVFMPDQATADRTEQIAAATDRLLTDEAPVIQSCAAGGYERIVYLGSGPLRGLAQEAALKMLELTAGDVLSYHDTPLGFRHGPKSVVNERTLAVIFVSNEAYARRYDEDIVAELSAQCGSSAVVAVAARGFDALAGASLWREDKLAETPDWMLVFPYLVRAQLLALYTSVAHGKTVDNPFPSGNVNRVVQGVTIHPFNGTAA